MRFLDLHLDLHPSLILFLLVSLTLFRSLPDIVQAQSLSKQSSNHTPFSNFPLIPTDSSKCFLPLSFPFLVPLLGQCVVQGRTYPHTSCITSEIFPQISSPSLLPVTGERWINERNGNVEAFFWFPYLLCLYFFYLLECLKRIMMISRS